MVDRELKKVELTVPSDPEYMALVRAVCSTLARKVGFDRNQANSLTLAVDEACTNVIKHAYHHDYGREMVLTVEMHPDRLLFRLRDFGSKTDPATIKGRDLKKVKPGGLGVHFMRQIMDEVEYDTTPDVGTELRMTKYLSTVVDNPKGRQNRPS